MAKEARKQPKPSKSLPAEERQRLIEARKGKKTVIIFGWADATRDFCPWEDLTPDIEVWGLNEAYNDPSGFLPDSRATGWFQLHPRWDFMRSAYGLENHNDSEHHKWLQAKHDFPIWLQQEFPDIPSGKRYPLDEICKEYVQPDIACYFKSTAAMMVALAIHLGKQRIEIYGVEMTNGDDYVKQRANFEFWLGVAMGRGIERYAPPGSSLAWAGQPLYGYDQKPRINTTHLELRLNMYATSAKNIRQQFEAVQVELTHAKKTGNLQRAKKLEAQVLDLAQRLAWVNGSAKAMLWAVNSAHQQNGIDLKLQAGISPNDLAWSEGLKLGPDEEPREGVSEEEPAADIEHQIEETDNAGFDSRPDSEMETAH